MLTVDMTVREVLRLLLDSADRHIPLVESRALPLLLGSVTNPNPNPNSNPNPNPNPKPNPNPNPNP